MWAKDHTDKGLVWKSFRVEFWKRLNPNKKLPTRCSAMGRNSSVLIPYWVIVWEQPGGSMTLVQAPCGSQRAAAGGCHPTWPPGSRCSWRETIVEWNVLSTWNELTIIIPIIQIRKLYIQWQCVIWLGLFVTESRLKPTFLPLDLMLCQAHHTAVL